MSRFSNFQLTVDVSMQLIKAVFSKNYIRCGLLCLIFLNSLLGVSGGVILNVHHDFSFHLADGMHVEDTKTEHTTGPHLSVEGSHHHHHQIVISGDELPVFRTNEIPKAEFSAASNLILIEYPVFKYRDMQMATTALSRAPPEVMQSHLDTLRTQVLRL